MLNISFAVATVVASCFHTMDIQTKAALWLAHSPANRMLAAAHRKLSRYMDLAENWNNGDEQSNGEAWLIRQLAPHLRLAFDIGANVGRWTSMLSQVTDQCTIHAFEPSPSTFANLSKALGAHPRVKVHPLGLGDAAGVCLFNDYGENSGFSSFASRKKSVGMEALRQVEVPVTTFDEFCSRENISSVDFVKIDTEGYEMAVLRGMRSSLEKRRVALVQFEYGGTWLDAGETLAGANDLLSSHGYQLFKLYPTSLVQVHYDCRRYECFKYANFVAAASMDVLQRWGVPFRPD